MAALADFNFFSAYASTAATLMLLRTLINDVVPVEVKSFLYTFFHRFLGKFLEHFFSDTKITLVIDEEIGFAPNQVFDAAEIYLRTIVNTDTKRFKAAKTSKQKSISLSMAKDEEVVDCFRGIEVKWQLNAVDPEKSKEGNQKEKRYFELSFSKAKKATVVEEYLPFVLSKAQEMKASERAVKLYTRDGHYDNDDDDSGSGSGGGGYWGCINLDHPATFDKLAMEPELKRAIIGDLDRFIGRKEYYRKVGKAWKRGYLLYGPPGTGKSSLIAAIANYLKFDVYDLELSSVYDNSELRRLLLYTKSKSIIVIEDIDCSTTTHDRAQNESSETQNSFNPKLTLSGVLNFVDGMWSTCGDERIFIFTTNHKEKLDPALLRPGRMDMHIHLGYCTPNGFDVLAGNYLGGIGQHKLFPEIKRLISEVEITPAEVAEQLMRNDDAEQALGGMLDLLEQKKKKQIETREESERGKAEKVTETLKEKKDEEKEKWSSKKKDEEKEKWNFVNRLVKFRGPTKRLGLTSTTRRVMPNKCRR